MENDEGVNYYSPQEEAFASAEEGARLSRADTVESLIKGATMLLSSNKQFRDDVLGLIKEYKAEQFIPVEECEKLSKKRGYQAEMYMAGARITGSEH